MTESSTAPVQPSHEDAERETVKARALDRLLDDTNVDRKVWDEVFEIIWDASRPPEPSAEAPEREALAEVLALVGDYDGCFEEIREWGAREQWEKVAHPADEPLLAYEDAESWKQRADAALAWFATRHQSEAEIRRDQAEIDASIARVAGRLWSWPRRIGARDLASVILAQFAPSPETKQDANRG